MNLSLIVAIAENGVIGGDNKLLWHLPADLKYFKQLTTGNIIIMGRKTYESIGKPLPNRINIVISRDLNYSNEGCINVNSIEEAIEIAENLNAECLIAKNPIHEIFVIGGAQIYKLAIVLANKLYVTEVKAKFEGDTYFDPIDKTKWSETSRIAHSKDEKNTIEYDFVVYQRNN
jgi:dihydrofolate reductase